MAAYSLKCCPTIIITENPKLTAYLLHATQKSLGMGPIFRDWYWQIVAVDISFVMTVWAVEKNKNLERTGAIFCSPIYSVTTAPYLVRLLEKKKVFESGPP